MLLKFSDISGNDGLLGTNNSDTPFVTCQSTCMCKRHRQYQWLICTESLLCARKLFIPCNNMLRQVLLFSSFYASGNWGSETWSNLPRVTEQGSAPKPDRRVLRCDPLYPVVLCGKRTGCLGAKWRARPARPTRVDLLPLPLGSPGPQRDFSDDLSLQFGNWWPWQLLSLRQLSRQRAC